MPELTQGMRSAAVGASAWAGTDVAHGWSVATAMYRHGDPFDALGEARPLADHLAVIHRALRRRCPFIARIAVALVDHATGTLRTFVDSSGGGRPLVRYEARLDEVPSLAELLRRGRPRVVDDLSVFGGSPRQHSVSLRAQGYRSSYTVPLRLNGVVWGIVFFDATCRGAFTPEVLETVDVYAHLVSAVTTQDLAALRMLLGALKTAVDMMYARDPETAAHLERMARFARLIARELAARGARRLDDEFIERLLLFAPLHDIGKIGVPDHVLFKRGRLTRAEFALMKTHAARGARIIDAIVRNFHLGSFPFIEMLRAVVEMHHEALDGSGYPRGLREAQIPIEARIVAVADVFDALSSRRRYKKPWSNERAFTELRALSPAKLDHDCVAALMARRREVERIQRRFPEAGRAKGPRALRA